MNATLISIILTAFMIVGWILSLVLEIVNSIIVKRVDILMESFMNDVALVINTVNFFMKISNKDVVPIPNEHEQEIEEMLKEFLAKHGVVQPSPAPVPQPAPTPPQVAQSIAPAKAPTTKKKLFGRKNK